ncbi:MAG: hypothetical protein ACE10K_03010, partial [Rhodothermales bacterium]
QVDYGGVHKLPTIVWEVGGMGEKTKMEDSGSKIEWVSIRFAILDHPSSILKLSPTPPTSHTQ